MAKTIETLGYDARACTRLFADQPMWNSAAQRAAEQALGATLPPRALRALFAHIARHLDVDDMRDLPGPAWSAPLPDGTAAQSLPDRHARLLWRASLTLGGHERDVPALYREG
ncbi:hypothetical protein [Ponticoccus alexandrii]|uniref:Uncharacterized protein n=1 Tax=Ponticoccus alexandrii TaxID=1943633 RepID=A0ABX7FA07_9RHOB|nr:hypothetical protein [Ponticoccus alexandrii]QRF67386.1 hypothetical protein GQA70_14365 [Ponticoccus alexandrii]